MIVSDEYLDEVLDRYDRAREKSWNEFFNKHFGKTMTNFENSTPLSIEDMTKKMEEIANEKPEAKPATVVEPVVI